MSARICRSDNRGGQPTNMVANPIFLNQSEAAQLLRVSARTLERWRLEGVGPEHRRFGRRVVYGRNDLLVWADGQRRTSTSDNDPSQLQRPRRALETVGSAPTKPSPKLSV